ncbi:hypothetical protein KAFR_0F02920 [Kazachstania africana CBS 2517]|uniref:NADH:ubiquinone reductase (non-electrogenic) n=1 Tax=Kazachstania africana (strain ATCC 22294 / BCRC 22015 / CBS 2517 / CECT 1963 / NBRC 1671 / NRRL Y-8276) TaxID=1071382 RepID=H2AWY8_KAZAF|nr:hypothetical protein KAFR_0F02920 [Kazachstania africana CBS 2517]CCF58888.1 hypothetical protein KAFR_0F02920 [Kazachstania africana CBS 2517]
MLLSRISRSRLTMASGRPFCTTTRLLQDKIIRDPLASNKIVQIREPLFKRVFRKTVRYSLLIILAGTGYVSYSLYRERNPKTQIPQTETFLNGSPKKNLVILGTGWGSVSLLKNLDTSEYNVTVVSPRNYFLFTPLLPCIPVGTVNNKSIVEPIRAIMRRTKGVVNYLEAEATDIDPVDRKIQIKVMSGNEIRDISYDYLVLGIGAQSTTFNIPGVYENAFFMKEISDAERIRSKFVENIEKASLLERGDPERRRLLSFVVVGGGPTGVEFAAELRDYIDQDLKKWVPEISSEAQVSLIEALPNILNMFDKRLVDYTEQTVTKANIDLRLNHMVKEVNKDSISANVKGEKVEIPFGLLVWATGNAPMDLSVKLMNSLAAQTEKRGLLINEKLQLLGAEDSIFALGDCTFHKGLFPTAQVAHQEGEYLARMFKELSKIDQLKWELNEAVGNPKVIKKLNFKITRLNAQIKDFHYRHMGTLAYIGADKAVVDVQLRNKRYSLQGSPFAFWFWRSAYLSMCISIRTRILVTLDWIKIFFLGRDSSV